MQIQPLPASKDAYAADRGAVGLPIPSSRGVPTWAASARHGSYTSVFSQPALPEKMHGLLSCVSMRAALQISLLVVALAIACADIPFFRMALMPLSEATWTATVGRTIVRIAGDSALMFLLIPTYYNDLYPRFVTPRMWKLYGTIGTALLVPSTILLAFYGPELFQGDKSELSPWRRWGETVEDTLQIIYYVILPIVPYTAWGRAKLKLRSPRTAPGQHVTYLGVAWLLVVVYSAISLAALAFGEPRVLALSPFTLLLFILGLLGDRGRDMRGELSYAAALLLVTRAVALSAAGVLAVIMPVYRGSTVIILVLFSTAVFLLRLLWAEMADRLFGHMDSMPHLFVIQLLEDFFTSVVFLGERVDSMQFWLAALLAAARQVARDTFHLQSFATAAWRKLRGLPPRELSDERIAFKFHWRRVEQNVATEILASVVMTVLFAIDMLANALQLGASTLSVGMSVTEQWHQLGAFASLVLVEGIAHALVNHVNLSTVASLRDGEAEDDAAIESEQQAKQAHASAVLHYWFRRWPVFVAATAFAITEVLLRAIPLAFLLGGDAS